MHDAPVLHAWQLDCDAAKPEGLLSLLGCPDLNASAAGTSARAAMPAGQRMRERPGCALSWTPSDPWCPQACPWILRCACSMNSGCWCSGLSKLYSGCVVPAEQSRRWRQISMSMDHSSPAVDCWNFWTHVDMERQTTDPCRCACM